MRVGRLATRTGPTSAKRQKIGVDRTLAWDTKWTRANGQWRQSIQTCTLRVQRRNGPGVTAAERQICTARTFMR